MSLGFQAQIGDVTYDRMKDTVMTELKRAFNPEFLNRIDEVVVFHSLGREEMAQIVDILMRQVEERLAGKKIKLTLAPLAKELIVEKGFDPTFGARPLKRTIQKLLEDPLSEELLKGTVKDGDRVAIEREEDHLVFKVQTNNSAPKKKKELVVANGSK